MNPFASQFVSPSNCGFILPDCLRIKTNESNESVLTRLSRQMLKHRTVQIIGPHGSGKTTLAVELSRRTVDKFRSCHSVILRRTAGAILKPNVQWIVESPFSPVPYYQTYQQPPRLLLIDGIESLGLIQQRLFLRQFTNFNFSIVLTTHRLLIGINVLTRIKPELDQFVKIIDQLQKTSNRKLSRGSIEQCYCDNGRNFRDAIWSLYDCWERNAQQV